MTCCASMSPTTSCCAPPTRMPATGLLDIARLGDMLKRVQGRIVTRRLDRVSPLAVPALLEIAKEMVAGEAHEDILREAEEALIREAMRVD